MSFRETINWLSVLYLLSINKYMNNRYIVAIWITILIIEGNIKNLRRADFNTLFYSARSFLYIVPFFLTLFLEELWMVFDIDNRMYLLLGCLCGLVLHIPQFGTWQIMWNLKLSNSQKNQAAYISYIFIILVAPLGEELFFRAAILQSSNNTFIGMFTSTILFVLNHFGTKWGASFSKNDLLVQIIYSLISCNLFYFSGSVLPCIVAHFFYNLPIAIIYSRCYLFCENKKGNL